MSDAGLTMTGVSKKFRRGELYDSLRDFVPALARRVLHPPPPGALERQEFWALRDISFEARRGEALGIIGRNGAGKSTILKLLARIMSPTLGTLSVRGRLSAMIEVGAGFHPDLTGRENVFLNGTILGMRREEIRRKFDAIVDFSGLSEALDTPVKRYSSGMLARLGFAVAAHVDPDVLIVDEVLSVGDFVFQRRCIERMHEVLRSGVTVLFVSHDLRTVATLCSRALLLERGTIKAVGPSGEIVRQYLSSASDRAHATAGKDAYLSGVRVRGAGGEGVTFRSGERVWIDVDVAARVPTERLAVVLDIMGDDHYTVFNTSTERLGTGSFALGPGETFRCSVALDLHLAQGTYTVAVYLHRYDVQRQYDDWYAAATMFVTGDQDVRGVANLHPVVTAFGTAARP